MTCIHNTHAPAYNLPHTTNHTHACNLPHNTVCSADTEWLIVTNGDNEYASTLYAELEATPDDVDLLAFDYYSRYQRSTGPPCYRFSPGTMAPKCKRNLLKWCHTDLGANVFSYPRFMREDRRFGQFKNEYVCVDGVGSHLLAFVAVHSAVTYLTQHSHLLAFVAVHSAVTYWLSITIRYPTSHPMITHPTPLSTLYTQESHCGSF